MGIQKTIFIILTTFFHTCLFGCNNELVNEILGTNNNTSLKQRLKITTNEFGLSKHRKMNYKLSIISLHGIVQMCSKECPIYYEKKSNDEINCEHIVPQSFFNHVKVMKSDLHHIYPAYKSINLARGVCKFAEIPDEGAEFIYLTENSSPSLETTFCKSTCKISKLLGTFEPSNESKGRVARACAYFFTKYAVFLTKMWQVIDINTMVEWHEKYPPDGSEKKREKAVFYVQKNHNPYITQPVSYMREVWLGS